MLIDVDTRQLVSLMGKPLEWWLELREWAEEQGYPNCNPIHPDSRKVCDHEWTISSDNAWCVKCGTLRIEAQPTSLKPEYFVLGDEMYHVSQILYLKLDGGVHGHGCWGKIQLKGMEQPVDIGDGSYQGDSRHIQHLVAGEFGFKRLRQIMRDYGIQGASR